MKKESMWEIRRLSADQIVKRLEDVRKAEAPRRTKIVSGRFDPKDAEVWRLAAASAGIPFNLWMETVLNLAAEKQLGLSEEQRTERLKNT